MQAQSLLLIFLTFESKQVILLERHTAVPQGFVFECVYESMADGWFIKWQLTNLEILGSIPPANLTANIVANTIICLASRSSSDAWFGFNHTKSALPLVAKLTDDVKT